MRSPFRPMGKVPVCDFEDRRSFIFCSKYRDSTSLTVVFSTDFLSLEEPCRARAQLPPQRLYNTLWCPYFHEVHLRKGLSESPLMKRSQESLGGSGPTSLQIWQVNNNFLDPLRCSTTCSSLHARGHR